MDTYKDMLLSNLGLKKGESVVVVTDYENLEQNKEALEVFKAALSITERVQLRYFKETGIPGKEPPFPDLISGFDVAVLLTKYSLTHTDARRRASREGTRVASMPGFTSKMKDALLESSVWMKEQGSRLKQLLDRGKKINLSGKNCDLEIEIGNKWKVDSGDLKVKGASGNLPAGEIFSAPLSAKGWFSSFFPKGRFEIEDGVCKKAEGEHAELIMALPENGFVAELGIGLNRKARPSSTLEGEKIYGTVHIAFGDNTSMEGGGNSSQIHLDHIIENPTLSLDGKVLIEDGEHIY
jgi:aminopeptidase